MILNAKAEFTVVGYCLLYTSDAADEEDSVDLGGRRIIEKNKKNIKKKRKRTTQKKKRRLNKTQR